MVYWQDLLWLLLLVHRDSHVLGQTRARVAAVS